jgi:hypothetical protein
MNVIHAFMLILSIAGQPDKGLAICETYKKCVDQEVLIVTKLKLPGEYRIIPIIIMREAPIT